MAVQVRLGEVLVLRGMTLDQLARETRVSRVSLWRLMTGRSEGVRFSTLDALCVALRCTPGELLEHVADSAPHRLAPEPAEPEIPMDDDQRAVLAVLADQRLYVDDVIQRTGMGVTAVLVALLSLELGGLVGRTGALVHRRRPAP